MRMQGNDYYCGLRCLITAADRFGLTVDERPIWQRRARRDWGIDQDGITAIASRMGLEVRQDYGRTIRHLRNGSLWMARIWCRLPDETGENGVWEGAHYVLVFSATAQTVKVGDPYPQALPAIRGVPWSTFRGQWSRERRWALEILGPRFPLTGATDSTVPQRRRTSRTA